MNIRWHPLTLHFPCPEVEKPEAALSAQLEAALSATRFRGLRVAVAVGSRGIADIARWVGVTVEAFRRVGAEVVVVPAMGSHGGGTPESQAQVLADLGITAKSMGVPLVSRAEVVRAGTVRDGLPVWCDATAWAADRLVPINRVKPHTAFRGSVESGPSKLLAVGLGKNRSAEACHRAGLAEAIPAITRFWLASGRVPCGVALVENAQHTLAEVAVLRPADWLERESLLLDKARDLLPRLPWETLDLLVVEQLGKDISGTGMDLNIIGMGRRFPGQEDPPQIRRVVALDLTAASHGNANGLGYADWVTERLVSRVDWEVTRANARAAGFMEAARLPRVAPDAAAAVAAALAELQDMAGITSATVRAVRICDTSHLTEIEVSPALLAAPAAALHTPCR